MARFKSKKWLQIAAGLLIPSAGVALADGFDLMPHNREPGSELQLAQDSPLRSRTYATLNDAIESYRKGEYETAERLFKAARAGWNDLTPQQQADLNQFVTANNAALQGRRDAAELLRQAELAERDANAPRSLDLAQKALANQYLSPLDKPRAVSLVERLRTRGPISGSPAIPPVVKTDGRAKLVQARQAYNLGDFDRAEALAHEAERAGAPTMGDGDTPRKLIDEVVQARSDPKKLLTFARQAYQNKDYDRAEMLAKSAEKAESSWTMHVWGDSPGKVLKDVQAARTPAKPADPSLLDTVKNTLTGSMKPDVPVTDPMKPTPVASNDTLPKSDPAKDTWMTTGGSRLTFDNGRVLALLEEGRKALRDGKLEQAKKCAHDAEAFKDVKYDPKDDTPAKLLADVQRAESQRATTVATAKPDVKPAKPEAKDPPVDPKLLLKQGRDQLNAGKFDEAFKLAQKARTAPGASWSLFDLETPDKLIADIDKARTKHDKEEAARLLVTARQKMEIGTPEALKEADKLTYKAEILHPSYSVWEYFEDQPTKLRAEIAVRLKGKPSIPPPPAAGGAVAGNDAGAGRWTGGTTNPPAADDAQVAKARGMMAKARASAKASGGTPSGEAEFLIEAVEDMNIPAEKLGKDSPAQVRNELKAYGLGTRMVKANPIPPPVDDPIASPKAKEQAKALLAQARRYQANGSLLEARAAVIEAQRRQAIFGADEDRPEKALLELAGSAQRRIDADVSRADDLARSAAQRPMGLAEAETNLSEAQALAQGFGLDRHMIDAKLVWVRTARNNAALAGINTSDQKLTPVVANASDGGPQTRGQELLNQSRYELRAGHTAMARQLAEQAYSGQFGVQEDATALLRSIDTEDYRQKQRVARDTYEAGRSAFLRKDYQYAAGILRSLDVAMLTDLQKSQLRDLLALPEMQANRPPIAVTSNQTPGTGSDDPNVPGRTKATDEESRQGDLIHQTASLENIKVQKLRRESLDKLTAANARAREGNLDSAIEILQRYLDDVANSGVQSHDVEMMRRQVDSRMHQFELVRDQNQRYAAVDDKTKQAKDKVARNQLAEQTRQQRLKELMEEYTKLYKSAKYAEAQTYAEQAHDIDPDNPVVTAALQIAQTQKRLTDYRKLDKEHENTNLEMFNDVERIGPAITSRSPLKYDKETWDRARLRKAGTSIMENRMSPAEREIERQMTKSVSISFKDTPLGEALNILSDMTTEKTRVNIAPDLPSMRDAGVTLDHPVTIRLDNISLKSALNLLLNQVGLTWTISNDALVITTKDKARGEMKLAYYQVTELVVPLDAPAPNLNGTLVGQNNGNTPAGTAPLPGVGTPPSPGASTGGSSFASTGTGGASTMNGAWVTGRAATRENELIKFIQETIAPKTWADMGGQGTINYFPMTMTLAIYQNPQVQEDISDLLNSLRRLQDVEVAVEYRLISLDEDFYEKIGLDFAMNIVNKGASKYEPTLLSGAFAAPGQIQAFNPSHFLTGLTPAGTFTSDLGFPIASSSYNLAYNNLFGGFPNNPLGNGGINLGLAFLSDIQVFMLLEAAQGNNRAQVMQAPRVTAFNGQLATMTAGNTQPYSLGGVFTTGTALNTLQFTPVTTNLTNRSATITVTPVISADRRFVRLTQVFTLTNTVPTVPLFPIVQALPLIDGGNGVGFTLVTNYIQQPAQDFMSVSTSVAVPDGGTVLIGGFKQLSESRSEYGPPLIGKIPYLDRLFRNVGYGREVQNLVFLVTPRIIINEEEEQIQFGAAVGAPR